MADPRRNANTQNADANAAVPRIRVLPANDDMLKFLAHPRVPQPFVKGQAMEWPLDSFTRRRIRDGDVTIEEGQEDLSKLVSEHAVAADEARKTLRAGGEKEPVGEQADQANVDQRADQPHTGSTPHVSSAHGTGTAGTNRAQRSETARQHTLRDSKPDTA